MSLPIECADGCGRMFWSIAAMMSCPCRTTTVHGYPVDEDHVHPFTD